MNTQLSPTHDPSRVYDDAILAWRAAPSASNYEARERARKAYYAGIGRYAGDNLNPELHAHA